MHAVSNYLNLVPTVEEHNLATFPAVAYIMTMFYVAHIHAPARAHLHPTFRFIKRNKLASFAGRSLVVDGNGPITC